MNQVHPCTQYALDVVEGRRVAGHLERLACQRHLNDLARQDTDAFPYVFNEGRANRVYTWFSYCKHIEGPLAGKPIKLLPFQLFDLGCVFGWVHRETGYRRFEKVYDQRARKNGKSTELAGVGLYMMAETVKKARPSTAPRWIVNRRASFTDRPRRWPRNHRTSASG